MNKFNVILFILFAIKVSAQVDKQPFLKNDLKSSDSTNSSCIINNQGGEFTPEGWKSISNKGKLIIVIPEFNSLSGRFEVDIANLDWENCNRASGIDKKLHFINLFSNPLADHHAENGGTPEDAIITLRAGTDEHGKPRYGNYFKLLWSSRGAKRTPNSLYHEKAVKKDLSWSWDENSVYHFTIEWNHVKQKLMVWVNEMLFYEVDWIDSKSPMQYIYLGAANDFASLQGCIFSNLKLYKL